MIHVTLLDVAPEVLGAAGNADDPLRYRQWLAGQLADRFPNIRVTIAKETRHRDYSIGADDFADEARVRDFIGDAWDRWLATPASAGGPK